MRTFQADSCLFCQFFRKLTCFVCFCAQINASGIGCLIYVAGHTVGSAALGMRCAACCEALAGVFASAVASVFSLLKNLQ